MELIPEISKRRKSSVLDYEESLMVGQYREELSNIARIHAAKLRAEKRLPIPVSEDGPCSTLRTQFYYLLRVGSDWYLLIALGVILASLSFLMDIIIHELYYFRNWLITDCFQAWSLQYLAWIAYTVVLLMSSCVIVKVISPRAAGSGVGEMKVILRGAILKEYLSFKTLIAKTVGLPFVLGSGIPLGKEGPFVHIAAMVTNQFLKLFGSISSELEHESRFLEALAVACAVGVAATFAAPVGGVLYSIEIVSVFFSVRCYWQGFFAATWGALLWRLLTVWFQFEDAITHVFKTEFRKQHPYETSEVIAFALLGVLCGLAAFVFVTLQKHIVLFNRRHAKVHNFLQKHFYVYPILVTTFVAVLSFPNAFGQYYASWLTSEQAMHQLFSNYTWGNLTANQTVGKLEFVNNWKTDHTSIFTNTFLFFVANLVLVALTSTMPVPAGLIVPTFKIGAGLGRFYGEWLAYLFPDGINPYESRRSLPIVVGAYSVAGSAAFAGASTGALSSAVIAFEMTGQLTHLIPIIVAVIFANIVAQYLGPSVYDSLIRLKKLPYLPPIRQSSSRAHRVFVEDFMNRDFPYVYDDAPYSYVKDLLSCNTHIHFFPFVKSPESLLLLGTIARDELQNLLDAHGPNDNCLLVNRMSSVIGNGSKFNVVSIRIPENEAISNSDTVSTASSFRDAEHKLNFNSCQVEPASFQLVQGTSLIKTHQLFSVMGLQQACVTSLGRLVGIVRLEELQNAIESLKTTSEPRFKKIGDLETHPLRK